MRILGVDPGSTSLGWGIVEGSRSRYQGIAYGAIKSSPKDEFPQRLLKIHSELCDIVERFSPDCLSMEEAFYAKNVKVALKLGQVRGVVLFLAADCGLEIAEYSPRLIKKTVVGYGNAEKGQVQEMVKILLKLDKIPQPNDASDALATAICHFHHAAFEDKIIEAKKK